MTNRLSKPKVIFAILIVVLLVTACGPTEEEFKATDTKIAEEVFATQTAAAPTATNTNTPGPTFTPSLKPSEKRTATAQSGAATAVVRATEDAQSMADLVQELYDDSYLQSTQGEYMRLNDFEDSFAQINWVSFRNTGISLKDYARI